MLSASRPRLAILNNILPPYRVPIYRGLAETFETRILLSGHEDNRAWDTAALGQGLSIKVVPGMMLRWRTRNESGVTVDLRYTHVNPSYFLELQRFRPRAILSTEMGFRSLAALAYGRLFRVPVWLWWGGTPHTERQRAVAKRVLRRTLVAPLTPRWISYGQTSTEYLCSIGVRRERIVQIQNCVDDELFQADVPPRPLDVPAPRALFVGQLIGRKGIFPLLEATAALQRAGKACSRVVVGDGPERGRFEAEVRRLGLRHVQHIRQLPPRDLPGVYRNCDFMVFPTLEDVWGLVVNEALLCGTPVIASRFAGCAPELLPAENIFDPLDQRDFLDAYGRALDGRLAPPDRRRLLPAAEVARLIARDVEARVRGTGGRHEPMTG